MTALHDLLRQTGRDARGPCQDDPDLWFSSDPYDRQTARGVCAECPMKAACLETALKNGEVHGMWGGLTPQERTPRAMAERAEREAARAAKATKPSRRRTWSAEDLEAANVKRRAAVEETTRRFLADVAALASSGQSIDDVANAMGRSAATIRRRLNRNDAQALLATLTNNRNQKAAS